MLGTSKYYKISAIFSDTKEIRSVYYVDGIVFEKDCMRIIGGMLNLEEPIVSYGLRLGNVSDVQSIRKGDFIPNLQPEGVVYFDAVDKITLTGIDSSESIIFEKTA